MFDTVSLMKIHKFMLPPKILFGINAVDNVGVEASRFGKKALLISDSNIEKAGILERVQKRLEEKGVKTCFFDEGGREPTIEVANAVAKVARKDKYDLVIGLGGGSVMDMAKVASIAVTNTGEMEEYLGVGKVKRPGISLILISTTAGTGSEVTPNSIIILPEKNLKTGIISPYILADVAITDPTLTLSVPPKVTAATGLDALSHAIEALMSTEANPLTDALAYEAVKLIGENLRLAYAQGTNLEARYGMSLGCLMSGIALANAGVCIGHAAAYTFAAKHHVSHGVSCGLVLPYVMEFNSITCIPKLARVATALTGKTYLTLRDASSDAAYAVKELMIDVDLPTSLKEIGISKEEIPEMAEALLGNTRLLSRNPRIITKKHAVLLFEKIWEGRLEKD